MLLYLFILENSSIYWAGKITESYQKWHIGVGWPKKHKNVKFENVPLSCGYMDQVEKKSLKDCIVSKNIQPALCRLKLLITLYKAQKKVFQNMPCGYSKLVSQGAW